MKPAGTEARGARQTGGVTAVAGGVLLAVMVLCGCTAVGPKYVKPKLSVPDAWTRATTSGSPATQDHSEDLSHWWRQLGDPVLSSLIERSLAASPDMRSARAKLREARARRRLAGAEHFPTVTGSTSISLSKTGNIATSDLYSAGFDASWEPDVFGATRRGVEAAQADLEATGASLHDTQVSLAAEVAANYVELRGYQGRLKIARENLATQTETLELTSW